MNPTVFLSGERISIFDNRDYGEPSDLRPVREKAPVISRESWLANFGGLVVAAPNPSAVWTVCLQYGLKHILSDSGYLVVRKCLSVGIG